MQRGNILFLILLAVVLFAALSYAVTQSIQGGGNDASSEIADLEAARQSDYITLVQNTALRLELIEGCASVDYTIPADQPGSGDFSCYMFHPDGGAVPYEDFGLTNCDLEGIELSDLAVGQSCGNVVFAGTSSGNRIYTTATDQGNSTWNSGASPTTRVGVISLTNGQANTDAMIAQNDSGSPYDAAVACRTLGPDWYLPARDELANTLYANRNVIGNFTTNRYWSSSEQTGSNNFNVWTIDFSNGSPNIRNKNTFNRVRCVMQENP